MEVIINNETVRTEAQNLRQLMEEKFPEARGIAVAVGTQVVPRARWEATLLTEQSVITVISATRGG